MTSQQHNARPAYIEFVILMSLMMALTALSIDAMLPALSQISGDLQVQNANDRQLVVSMLFLGLAIGQLFFGPLSDSTGRKPAMYAGYGLYIAGSLLAVFAISFPMMLLGRLLQGVGVSAPRAVSLALVRDLYEGRAMARVMSFIMTVFILVPMIAPTIGQAILLFAGWRSIFSFLVLFALVTLLWFFLRIPETLVQEKRVPFSPWQISNAVRDIAKIRITIGYTVVAGLVSGAHIGYLNSAQQVFQELYGLQEQFPLYFAIVALAIGVASFLNARMVLRYGMRLLVKRALQMVFILSVIAIGVTWIFAGQPPLWTFMIYLILTFFCIGILFGNNNAIAMQPLGHAAGTGSAVVGSLSTLMAVPLGTVIGRSYNETIFPVIIGTVVLIGLCLLVIRWAEAK